MARERSSLLLACLTALCLAAATAVAEPVALDATPGAERFAQGRALYEAEAYAEAALAFRGAVEAMPGNDQYLYWLGKTYGRLAEQSGWLKAIEFARLTRESFERALSANPTNTGVMQDLARYYEQAPAFLGGSPEKARMLRDRLAELTPTES